MAGITPKDVYAGVPNSARGEVTHICADPSGSTDSIAFPCGRVAVIRSTSKPLECTIFSQHANPVTCIRFSPDGSKLASGDECGFVRVWQRDSLKQLMDEQVMSGPVRDVAFGPDEKYIVVSGEARGSYAKVIKVPSGGSAGICTGHTKRVIACDASSTKPGFVATASEDMAAGLYKGPPIREIDIPAYLKHHTAFVNDVRFSPDGATLAIASSDKTVSLVDVKSGAVSKTLQGHTGSVTGLAWTKDSLKLLSSSNDKTTRFWDVSDGSCTSTVTFGNDVQDMQVGCAHVTSSSSNVSVSLRGNINITPVGDSAPAKVLRGHSKQVVGLAVVGSKAYSGDYSGLLVSWDIGVGSADLAFNGKGPSASVCAVAANDQVVANVGQDGKVFVTSTSSLTFQKPVTVKGGGVDIAVPTNSSTSISAIMINESRVAALSPAGDAICAQLDLARGETGTSIAVSADASMIAIGVSVSGGSGELRFLKFSGGASSIAYDGEAIRMPSPPNRLAFSPDGSIVAVGEASRRVKMYDVSKRASVTGGGTVHTARVDAITFDGSGSRVASGGMDGSIAIWPVNSEDDPVRLLSAHRSGVTGIGFADAATIVSSGGDSCLRSWTV